MTNTKLSENLSFKKFEIILWGVFFLAVFLLTSHQDIVETANHSYIFLDSIFSGNVLDFYAYVQSRPLDLYYTNYANYNILTYLIFGIWQLPLFAFSKIFSVAIASQVLVLWTKLLSVAFFVGCGYMVKLICQRLGLSDKLSLIAALFFLFNPIAFFSPMVMGQYDTLCLFFMLWSLLYYIKGDMTKFSLLMGASVVFKFFSLLAFIPLLLLKNKKLLHIAKYALITLWLYIPTTLLYFGRAPDANGFTRLMFERVLATVFPTALAPIPVFLFLYALICVFAYFYSNKENLPYLTVYLPMAVYALLFVGMYWHPQWLIMLVPFLVITTFLQKNKHVYWYIDIALCFGFFMTCFREFSSHFGVGIFFGGALSVSSEFLLTANENATYIHPLFLSNIPFFDGIVSACFAAGIFAHLIFKFPFKNISLSDRLSAKADFDNFSYKTSLYCIFAIGLVLFWLVPATFELLNSLGVV